MTREDGGTAVLYGSGRILYEYEHSRGVGTMAHDDRPASWVSYGTLLKFLRKRAGMTQEQLADAMGYSADQCASVEQGRRPAKAEFTARADVVLKTDGMLAALQKEVDRAQLPAFFRGFADLEADAVSRFSYDPMVIPGLLQTKDYARTLISASSPPPDDETIEQRLAARMARQSLLTQQPPVAFVFILEEASLHRLVGGREVMRTQLNALLEHAKLRNVVIQIMPTAKAVHPGLDGHIVLLETAEQKRLVYAESHGCVTSRVDPEDVSRFWIRYGDLRTQALGTEESVRLIEQVAGEL